MTNLGKRLGGAKWLALAACALAWTGCTRQLMTPPSRIGEFETPKVLAAGEKSVTLSGGGDMGVIYIGVLSGSLLARAGLGQGREVGFDASLLKVDTWRTPSVMYPSPYVFSANSRFKFNPEGWERFFSLFGGVGFGYSEPAVFSTLETGFSLGWENPWIIPYIGSKGTLNMPIKTKAVDLTPRDSNLPPDLRHALMTWGAMNFIGVKLPFPFKNTPAASRPALIAETHYAQFWTENFTTGFLGMRGALQLPVRL